MSYDEYRSRSKDEKIAQVKSLERQGSIDALRELFNFAEKDAEKDVRKAAIDSILVINNPIAIPVLRRIQSDDKDRGTRNKAKSAANQIEESGQAVDESFSAADEERAAEDYRALDESERGQAGLLVKIEENLEYKIDKDGRLLNEEGEVVDNLTAKGKVEIINNGRNDRIWAIDAILENVDAVTFEADEEQGTAVFGNSFSLKELDPQSSKFVPFEFEVETPKLQVTENFYDLEYADLEAPPVFSRGEETGMKFSISVENNYDWALSEVTLKKYISDQSASASDYETEQGNINLDSDSDGRFVNWEIGDLPANSTVKATWVVKVTLPEGEEEPFMAGDTKVTYKGKETSLSGLNLDTITGSSSVFQFISRTEQEESPGDFDCSFELENTSEFEMDLKEVRIYEGPLDEGNVRLEWLGKDFPEEERSIDPGETFSLDPWTITVDDDGVIPQFGRELDLSVKYLFDADVIAECVLPSYALQFIAMEVTKSYEPTVIPSFRRTEVLSEQVVKSIGNTDIMYLQLTESIPTGFEAPTQDQVEILKGGNLLDQFSYEASADSVVITLEHMEETEIGALAEGEELIVKYPLYATAKPEEEFSGQVTALANVYPEVKPIQKEAEAGPITVIHERRKLKIGKGVSSTSSEDSNEYEVRLRGVNDGTATITNVEITDFLPAGFELVGDTHEDPPVGFEEHSSVNNGRAMKWIFSEVAPDQKVEIHFKIRASGEYEPKEVYKMLLG